MSDRDRKLAELMGMCDHKWRYYSAYALCGDVSDHKCDICGAWKSATSDPDFSTPEWRAKLMDWVVAQTWWNDFKDHVFDSYCDAVNADERPDFTGHLWRNLPDLVEEYWRERK